jgi:N-terminal domain on NACHT_NTPase and P-loop NTPases
MDPITAVGFAASILTFIDFSYQIVCGTYEVIKSGSTTENAHVSVVATDLDEITKELSQRPPGYSKHEEALNTLATECQGVSDELRKLLDRVKTKAGSSKWKSIKVALHSMWKKGEITELDNRLGKYRSEVLLRLVLILK